MRSKNIKTMDEPHRAPSAPPSDKVDAELNRQRLMSLINSMADGVIALDIKLRIVITNGAALNMLNINNDPVGQSVDQLLRPLTADGQPVDLQRLIRESTRPWTSRDWLIAYSPTDKINLYLSVSPVHSGYGRAGGYVLLLRDITREKSLEQEKDDFISVVSHELRTPITIAEGSLGNAELLFKRAAVDLPDIAAMLTQAHNQITFLADLVNDLSTLSRAERGRLQMSAQPLNGRQLVEELASAYLAQASNKHLLLQTETSASAEAITSSPLYVREILQNFLTNAIKYTEKGKVVIGLRPYPAGLAFYVSDTGIGIDRHDSQRIFERFYRADNSHTRHTSGTGLGLYVASKLASLIKARIEVKSRPGGGSTFTLLVADLASGGH